MAPTDQQNVVVFNYTWALPKATSLRNNPLVHHALDNWHLSGTTALTTGLPSGVGFTVTNGADLTGGGDGQRINIIGNPIIAHGDRTLTSWFNTSAFAVPAKGDPGNASRVVIRLPGANVWDASLSKKFPLNNERQHLELRWEAYNAFNHTQFLGVNTTAQFNPAGAQVNGQFGQVTSTRLPRVMQGSLRFVF